MWLRFSVCMVASGWLGQLITGAVELGSWLIVEVPPPAPTKHDRKSVQCWMAIASIFRHYPGPRSARLTRWTMYRQLGILGDLPARDFVVSPGFAGLVALLAAVIAASAVLYASRRARQRSEQRREREERRQAQARDDAQDALAWERWQWVVDNAGIEPAASEGATLGLGPAVTLELLGGLLRDAERLGDQTLAKAVAVYQEQLLLVLAQQAGPVSDIAGDTTRRSPDQEPRQHFGIAAPETNRIDAGCRNTFR